MRVRILFFISLLFCSLGSFAQHDTIERPAEPELPEPVDLKEIIGTDQVMQLVDQMPLWKGCDQGATDEINRDCSQHKIHDHIAGEVEFPKELKNLGLKGRVYVQFVINREGKVVDAVVVKGFQEHADTEALRVVNALPDFIPGSHRGQPVSVRYTLPISFMY
jgi:protein TonB